MTKRNNSPRPIPLPHQRLGLQRRYPDATVNATLHELVWRGTLRPTEYSDSYEVVISHNLRESPLVYVARPHLQLVQGKRLPHVFRLNLLCLHTLSRTLIASRQLANTLVPWSVEWLFFYEIWLASGGTWFGEGEHPRPSGETSNGTRRQRMRSQPQTEEDQQLTRLTTTLETAFHPTPAELDDLLHNSRL